MDYNSDDRYNRNGRDGQWDRWNSNASNSSYYNQPTHRPYGQGFIFASLVCGLLSTFLGVVLIGLPIGALGILFALLTYRKGKRMDIIAKTGLVTSVLGILFGIVLIVYAYVSMPIFLQDEAYKARMETFYNAITPSDSDMEFEEFWKTYQDFYGVSVEE